MLGGACSVMLSQLCSPKHKHSLLSELVFSGPSEGCFRCPRLA
uniref:Uncharacterized protein n=1 Tax=Anopheles quadriannulatus TaxID=34691 RepID=A0A182XQX5_ANOQN